MSFIYNVVRNPYCDRDTFMLPAETLHSFNTDIPVVIERYWNEGKLEKNDV